MARKAKMTLAKLEDLLGRNGLTLAEPFHEEESYPKNRYILCECKKCRSVAHYRIGYLKSGWENADSNATPTCSACKWRNWYKKSEDMKRSSAKSVVNQIAQQLEDEGQWQIAKYVRSADPLEIICQSFKDAAEISDPDFAEMIRYLLPPEAIDPNDAQVNAEKHGYELLEILDADKPGQELFKVKCVACGRIEIKRLGDVGWGCSCQSHPKTLQTFAPGESHLLCDSNERCLEWWAHDMNDVELFKTIKLRARKIVWWRCPKCGNTFELETYKMTKPNVPSCTRCKEERREEHEAEVEHFKRTPVSEVPELLAAWDDKRDPSTVMVYSTNWHGMCPGDGLCRFKCPNGHHPQSFPYTYLKNGCPFCSASKTKVASGGYLEDTNPELAAEWLYKQNGKWTPADIRENSKRFVFWKCLACGHEWSETPRERTKTKSQCPKCGKILDSLGWCYPALANQWSPNNPKNPWQVRPHANLSFTPEWICENNEEHVWSATLQSRVNGGGCPECADTSKSRIELDHFQAALKAFGTARSGLKVDNDAFEHAWTIDIFVPYGKQIVAIEYDGSYWHEGKEEVDTRKSRDLLAAGYTVIRLREDNLDTLPIEDKRYAELRVYAQAPRPKETMEEIRIILDNLQATCD